MNPDPRNFNEVLHSTQFTSRRHPVMDMPVGVAEKKAASPARSKQALNSALSPGSSAAPAVRT